MTPDRRTLLALFSFAFGLRILYAVLFGADPNVIPIRETYDFRIAASMATGWQWLTTPFSPNAPGYLVALAALFRITGPSWWAVVLFNATMGGITVLFLYRIGEKRLGSRVGLGSALWLGVFVSQMHFASLAVRDVMATLILVWLAFVLVKPFSRMRSSVWTGILYLALVYTEPMFFILLPVLIAFLGLRATNHRTLNVQYLFLFIATIFVLGTPWTIRNYIVHRDFIPISLKASRYTAPLERFIRAERAQVDVPDEARVPDVPGFAVNTLEYWRFARFADAPGNPAVGVRAEPAWSLRHNAASIVNFGVLLPLFVAGAAMGLRRRHRATLVLCGIVVCHWILRGFLGGSEEARLPVEPLVTLVAFYGLRELLEIRRRAGGSQTH